MRIDALTNLQQVYGVGKPKKAVKTGKVQSGRDAVEISSIGKDIQTVKAAVKAAPDVRANKVADIKKQIEAGTYNRARASQISFWLNTTRQQAFHKRSE